MLSTIIHDWYGGSLEEALEVANALDDICSPRDNHGFASVGVYSFHNPFTRELLYIGYTNDFHRRFMEHNGMGEFDPKASKWKEVESYFARIPKLAFSILVQSSMDQPLVYANQDLWLDAPAPEVLEAIRLQEGDKRAKRIEGAFIEATVKATGKRPPWNDRDANAEGREYARKDHYDLVRYLTGEPSIMTCKYTLRELSNDPAACGLEEALHGARIFCLGEAVQQGRNVIHEAELLTFVQRHDRMQAQLYDELGYAARAYPLSKPLVKD